MAGQYLLLEWSPSSDMRASQEILSNRKAPRLSSALEDAEAETLPPLPRGCGTAKECERGARASKARGETESREGAITRSSSSCSCSLVLALLLLLDCVIVLCAFPCLLSVCFCCCGCSSPNSFGGDTETPQFPFHSIDDPRLRSSSSIFSFVHACQRRRDFIGSVCGTTHYASTSMFQRVNFLTTLRSHLDVTCSYYFWPTLLTWMVKACISWTTNQPIQSLVN